MKKPIIFVSCIVLLFGSGIIHMGCDDTSSAGAADGGYDFPEQAAIDLNLAVYSELTDYAVRGPGTYSVAVADNYGSDVYNAKYWNEVTVAFTNHSLGTDLTLNGTGTVMAIMDSYEGMYIIEYSGMFTGQYNNERYSLVINYKTRWSSTFSCEGKFTVNGTEYVFIVDSSNQPGIPTS